MLSLSLALALLAGPAASIFPRHAARILAAAAALAVALAAVALAGAPASVPGASLDGIGSLVLVLTLGMGATVIGYAGRNLRHEPYRRRFTVLGSLVVASAALVGTADHLAVLAIAWLATSVATVALLRTGPVAGRDARSLRARRAFVVGDVALVGSVALLLAGGPVVAAGLLAVVAAAARSASGPFHRWLPDSLGAPTPTSALLHAGVVNGGPILLIKLSPELGGLLPVAVAAAIVGGATCVFAEAVMLTRADVKGRLAWSTIAQMSFTLLLCGLGLPLAAGLHLVAHGLYKGALFLGSGSSVRALVRDRRAPVAANPPRRAVASTSVAAALPALALAGVVVASGAHWSAELAVPFGLAGVAGYEAARAGLARVGSLIGAASVLAVVVALVGAYGRFTIELDRALVEQLTPSDAAVPVVWVIPVLAALAAVALTRDRAHGRLGAAAWALARRAGRPDPAFRIERPHVPVHRPALVHRPVPGPALPPDRIPLRLPKHFGGPDLAGAPA